MSHYDLVIIGSGPAGRTAAIQAGKLKRKVLVVDRKDRLGGVRFTQVRYLQKLCERQC